MSTSKSAESKNAEIKVRVTAQEKQFITERAGQLGMSMSDFIRSAAMNEDKIISLNEGAKIAELLGKVHQELIHCCANKYIPGKYASVLCQTLEEIFDQLNIVAEKLTDIHPADEEEG